MKIATKIPLLIIFLLAVISTNAFIAVTQIAKIDEELKSVAYKDIILTDTVMAISLNQLEKAILLERILRVSEEIQYEDISAPRKTHLLDNAKLMQDGFDKLTQKGALEILNAKVMIKKNIANAKSAEKKEQLSVALSYIEKLEQAHIKYDQLVASIFNSINQEAFRLDFEDIRKIKKDENKISNELKALLSEVQQFTNRSIINAQNYELKARIVLLNSLFISTLISTIIAFWLIRSISSPLKDLEKAAHKIGQGDFKVNLHTKAKDEIGEVSAAFNKMAKELDAFKTALENKNKELAENLEITQNQKKDLEKVNKELDRFVYTVSHDIAAPLTGIAGYGSYLEQKYGEQLDDKGRSSVAGIIKGTFRLSALIKDLLTLTKLSRVNNPYELIKVNDLVEPVRQRLEFNIRELKVDFIVQENMPEIVCDRIKMCEVFYNLINNAIKFSSKNNKAAPQIEVGYIENKDYHQMFVKDNGIGIAPEDQDKVFGMFKRLDAAREYEGTGAGLSIVKNVIEDHGGKIWIESKPGEGAKFNFTIPKNLKAS